MAKFSTVSMKEARESVLPPRRATQERYREYVRQLGTDSAGKLELDQLVTKEYALEDVNEAHRALAAGENMRGLIRF